MYGLTVLQSGQPKVAYRAILFGGVSTIWLADRQVRVSNPTRRLSIVRRASANLPKRQPGKRIPGIMMK